MAKGTPPNGVSFTRLSLYGGPGIPYAITPATPTPTPALSRLVLHLMDTIGLRLDLTATSSTAILATSTTGQRADLTATTRRTLHTHDEETIDAH